MQRSSAGSAADGDQQGPQLGDAPIDPVGIEGLVGEGQLPGGERAQEWLALVLYSDLRTRLGLSVPRRVPQRHQGGGEALGGTAVAGSTSAGHPARPDTFASTRSTRAATVLGARMRSASVTSAAISTVSSSSRR